MIYGLRIGYDSLSLPFHSVAMEVEHEYIVHLRGSIKRLAPSRTFQSWHDGTTRLRRAFHVMIQIVSYRWRSVTLIRDLNDFEKDMPERPSPVARPSLELSVLRRNRFLKALQFGHYRTSCPIMARSRIGRPIRKCMPDQPRLWIR